MDDRAGELDAFKCGNLSESDHILHIVKVPVHTKEKYGTPSAVKYSYPSYNHNSGLVIIESSPFYIHYVYIVLCNGR